MNSEKYWRRRADQRERNWHKKSQETIEKELARYYARSLSEIQKDIQALYGRFAADNHMSQVEARKLLQGKEFREWRYTIQEYVKQINAGNTGLLKELNTLAMRSRISRLDKLYSDTVMELDSLGRKTSASMKKFLSDAYKDNYYQSMYEIGRTVGLKSPRVVVSSKRLEDVLRDRWSGKNYSERIWKNQKLLGQTLKQEMVTAVHRGESVEAVSKRIAQRMNVSTKNATRLVRTELNYVENRAALESIKDAGMEYYRFIATLDNRTTPICREHDGRIVSVEEASPGDNLPPLHPNCRSNIAGSLYGPEDGHKQEGKRIARNEKGRSYYVPADMNYEQWHEKYVVKAQALPKNPHAGKAVLVDITPGSNGGDTVKVYEGEKIPSKLEEREREAEYGMPYGKDIYSNTDISYFDSDDFRSKFAHVTDKPEVNKVLADYAAKAVTDNWGTLKESMYLIDADTGKLLGSIDKDEDKIDSGIVYTDAFKSDLEKAIEQHLKIIGIHNHPEGYPPSLDDFSRAYKNKYYKGLAIGANGQVYEYEDELRFFTESECRIAQHLIFVLYRGGNDIDVAFKEVYTSFEMRYNILKGGREK